MNDEKFENEYGEIETIRLGDDSDPVVKRETEVAAVKASLQPPLPPARTVDQYALDQRAQGKEYCLRCKLFKYAYEFGKDERNTERRKTQTICLQCDSERKSIKYQTARQGKRSEGYRYQARQKKRRKRK